MINTIAAIFVIISYVTLVCFIAYKVMIFLMDKIIYYITTSRAFTLVLFAFFSVLCFFVGLFQLSEYRAGQYSEFSRIFPLSFGLALVFVVSIYFGYKKPNWQD